MTVRGERTHSGVPVYDRDGKRIDLQRFLSLEKDESYRRVGLDDVAGTLVSTVWIGVDAGTLGRMLIFETIVIGSDARAQRSLYSTLEEARDGHHEIVERLRQSATIAG